jgi:hypothetical protein
MSVDAPVLVRPGRPRLRDGVLNRVTDMNGEPPPRFGDDVQVTRVDRPRFTGEVGSWRVPGWVGLLAFMLCVSVLCLLGAGPQPWRATRWAWFWLLLLVPWLTVPGILLLGGSTGLLPPRRRARLTGVRGL